MTDFDVKHSPFFDELGNFGSLGQHGEQVDDGPYKIVDDDTMRIGSSTFHYDVTGDTLTLDPVITPAKRKEALAKPGDFSEAVWMVAVALPALRGSASTADRGVSERGLSPIRRRDVLEITAEA
jgi:hypothetical protein